MHGRTIPPALSVSGRNDLLAFARQELPEDAYMQLITYADELSRSLPHTRDVGFPPQIADMENIRHPAEEYAWTLLDEGRGSLWHAIRAIATLLPFDRCARRSASSPHMAFAAGAYGHHGYVGMHHHTQLMPRVCRLFNRFIFSICPDHRWTSFQVLCDSLLDMHIDSQNAKLDSFMIGISYFSEGAVWVQDSQGLDFEDVRGAVVATMARWVDDPAERSGPARGYDRPLPPMQLCPGGCQHEFCGPGHRHCCSLCAASLGRAHTRRCRQHQLWLARGQHGAPRPSVCSCGGCSRLASMYHDTCCSKCSSSGSTRHSRRCDRLLRASRQQDGSLHQSTSLVASSAGSAQFMDSASDTTAGFSQSVHVTSQSASATSAVPLQPASSSTDVPTVADSKELPAMHMESSEADAFKLDEMD
ncbi:unnamed protein product [Symbiodinium microadriaticum]|nr:unnamed protein product [Symbiodinium microadriaticum]